MTCTNINPNTKQYQAFQELKRGGFSSIKIIIYLDHDTYSKM